MTGDVYDDRTSSRHESSSVAIAIQGKQARCLWFYQTRCDIFRTRVGTSVLQRNHHRQLCHQLTDWHATQYNRRFGKWYVLVDSIIRLPWYISPRLGVFELTLTWTTEQNQEGPQGFCAGALDNNNLQSDAWCITYLVGFDSPDLIRTRAVQGSASPIGTIFSNHSLFSIQGEQQCSAILLSLSSIETQWRNGND